MQEKHCHACGQTKPVSEFSKNKARKDGLQTQCIPCFKKLSREHYRRNHARIAGNILRYQRSEKGRNGRFLRTFGITLEQYNAMFAVQGGVCAICGKPEKAVRCGVLQRLAVDHDHETGEVRGLLCGDCNRAVGLFDDDPERLLKAAEYLKRNSEPRLYEPFTFIA